jgi:HEAT repeat protein
MSEYEELEPTPQQPDMDTLLAALREGEDGTINAKVFYGLSGITEADLGRIQPIWEHLPAEYRHKVLDRLVDIAEANFDLDYNVFGRYALEDPDPDVRESAIEVLFDDTSLSLMDQLIDMAQWDEVSAVRASAASALGRFILAGELGELPEARTTRAQDAVVSLWSNDDEDVEVRRRALEAISNCGHDLVPDAILEAYESGDTLLRVSAIFAMGRSFDESWHAVVLRELNSDDPALRYEAARAAGELELGEAVPKLIRLAFDDEREVREVAAWSLGEIGGRDAVRALNKLADEVKQDGDEDLYEAVSDAIASASFMTGDFDRLRVDDD